MSSLQFSGHSDRNTEDRGSDLLLAALGARFDSGSLDIISGDAHFESVTFETRTASGMRSLAFRNWRVERLGLKCS